MKFINKYPLLFNTLEFIVIFLAFSLVNVNSFIRFRQFPEVDTYSDHEGDFILAAMLAVVLITLLLWNNQLLKAYILAWKNNKVLVIFLAYALLSLLWTIYFPATLYKLFFLFFATITGSYIAIRYQMDGVLHVLTWVGAIFSILSILLVLYFPFVGVMQNRPFVGSWTGMFWHRNHTGNIFAFFNMIFLLRFLFDNRLAFTQKLIIAFFYFLSALMVFGSRSATGIIVFLFLHFVTLLIAAWIRFRDRLRPWHYYGSAALLFFGFLVFITNTEFFFGLLGRSATMTGRVPLWEDLFQRVYLQQPVLGYGYGALWMLKAFRIEMQIRHNWPFQIYFADNGFFDILLNLGLVGLLLFLAVYIPLGVRSFRQAVLSRSWIYFFPFLTFLYIFIGNLTYSFLLEVDQFVWMLLVIMVFLTTSPSNSINPQP
jgi:O-antigen ligase